MFYTNQTSSNHNSSDTNQQTIYAEYDKYIHTTDQKANYSRNLPQAKCSNRQNDRVL